MSTPLEFKGRDVDEAINRACESLRTSREQLRIEVLATGSDGIFGILRRQAIIRASRKEQASREETRPESTDAPQPSPASPPRDEKGEQAVPPHHDLLRQELASLLSLMEMEAEISMAEQDNRLHLAITGPCAKQLTARDGQALDALQYLLGKITDNRLPPRTRFVVDCDNFRAQRGQELRAMARQLATEAKEGQESRTTPPLSPADRRLIHLTLEDDKDIRSRSVGGGLFKKVLIHPPGVGTRRRRRKR
ncbi:MAG: Jag N-terminal domain-containing protein [Thermodesulfobacteriota bacterium]